MTTRMRHRFSPIGTAAMLGPVLLLLALARPARLAAQEVHDIYHPVPKDTVPQGVYAGWKNFQLNCARCHGEEATGTSFAPNLLHSVGPDGQISSQAIFVATVCQGRLDKGMPSWCAIGLEIPTMINIYSYVKLRSDGKMGPGRPVPMTDAADSAYKAAQPKP
ncbi:MAG TPA: c-type cytochrome [Gemmatimonadales bacterium]|nr:c-type cytochrome [Gemmatimonadales bacterium]